MMIALVAVGLLAAAILTRIPLGFILMAAGIVGIAMIHPRGFDAGLLIAEQQLLEVVTDFQLSVLPLFILMGVFVARAGLADDLFDACYKWLGHLRGGVAIGAVAACAGFAAMSGSTAASAATMSKVAMPALRRFKYDMGFAAGTIAAGGTLGILIPPSGALIVYGLLTETSIADLFMAGLIPGILSALAYIAVAFVVATLRPDWGRAANASPCKKSSSRCPRSGPSARSSCSSSAASSSAFSPRPRPRASEPSALSSSRSCAAG